MARLPRVVVPGLPHHVTQRGARRMQVFFRDADYLLYLGLLGERLPSAGVEVLAYALLPNHVHLIVVPSRSDSLARAFRTVHAYYAELVNLRRGWTGHLWQQRFASFPMDQKHLEAAYRYVLQNPVRAGLSTAAVEWPWSSARAHAGLVRDPLITADAWPPERCALRLASAPDGSHSEEEAFRRASRTGRPLGDAEFVRKLESELQRPLAPRPSGRPPRKAQQPSGSHGENRVDEPTKTARKSNIGELSPD